MIQTPTENEKSFSLVYQQIKKILSTTISALKQSHPHAFVCKKQRALAIYGFDFMVDANMRIWLLEANHGSCFPTSDEHPLQKNLYDYFWHAFITSFVLPIATRRQIKHI